MRAGAVAVRLDGDGAAGLTRDLWHGSLLEDKRDGSGLLFRRNRYMDPATGRFTQEDPIGLAGGINLYGFSAGDPINFSDPFGICPEEVRDADGRCPGGLTVSQWRSFETAADELQPEARREALDMLNEGRIHSASWLPAKVSGLTNPITREISLNPEFVAGNVFEWMPARFGFLIAHELGHVRQFEHWGSAYSTISPRLTSC